jgi:hypothetical protein
MEAFFHKKPDFHPFAVGLQPLSKKSTALWQKK